MFRVTWLGYTRVSRVGGREHLISPELQQKRIAAFAEMRGFTVEMLPPELDVSGGKRSRPVLDAAIHRIEDGQVKGIIVSQIDRLSRMQMTSALTVIERIERAGGQVVAVAENVDPTTPEGRMARNMFLSLAAMQRERHAEQIAQAKERAVRHGIWPMSRIPPGYVKGEDRKLRFGPDAPKVRAAFRCRASGGSWREVGQILNGVAPSTARKIIQNRTYLGEITVGDWHNPRAHRPLIDRELFEAAQIEHAAPVHTGRVESLLKGLVRCGGCQRTMSWSEHAYRCLGRAPCDLRARVNHRKLDGIAVNLLFEWAGAAEAVETKDDLDLLSELEAAEAELAAFQRAARAAGDEELFADGLRQRAEAVRAARAKVANQPRADLPPIDLRVEWPGMSVDEKRHVLSGLFGVIWVWGQNDFRFIERGFEPDGLSRPGRKGPKPAPLDNTDVEGEIRVTAAHYVTER